ncbi:D-serine/D-alanine/glycine transporter [Edwardsiella tarda]|nr:D-serine/D-alanine/glycine transporter [Edwardsiella tarda]
MIKIVAIIALILIGLGMALSGFRAPSGEQAAFSNLWREGFFPHGISGFFAGFQIAVFAFVGIELVGTTAAETRNPHQVLPKAINAIPLRIIMFYVLALCTIMIVTLGIKSSRTKVRSSSCSS